MDLAGRNALVTGVSRRAGIGFAVARQLLNAAASVFVQGWTAHDAAQPWGAEPGGTEAVARKLGVPFTEADFSDPASPALVVSAARDALGPLDLLIVNQWRRRKPDPLGVPRGAPSVQLENPESVVALVA